MTDEPRQLRPVIMNFKNDEDFKDFAPEILPSESNGTTVPKGESAQESAALTAQRLLPQEIPVPPAANSESGQSSTTIGDPSTGQTTDDESSSQGGSSTPSPGSNMPPAPVKPPTSATTPKP